MKYRFTIDVEQEGFHRRRPAFALHNQFEAEYDRNEVLKSIDIALFDAEVRLGFDSEEAAFFRLLKDAI